MGHGVLDRFRLVSLHALIRVYVFKTVFQYASGNNKFQLITVLLFLFIYVFILHLSLVYSGPHWK